MAGASSENDPASHEILGVATDPSGTPVVLLRRVWQDKVIRDHPEVASLFDAVLRAVAAPDYVEGDPIRADRKRYFARAAGPSRWLLVVVSYEQAPARIISAFAHRKDPPRWSA
jgi:hypothetical protein